jgi:hypothetical protein
MESESVDGDRSAERVPGEPDALSGSRARGIGHPAWPDVLREVAEGRPLAPACAKYGLSPEAARKGAERDPEASEALERARAEGELAILGRMDTSEDWKREAWKLERLYPKRYHLPTKVTGVAAEDGGAPIASEVRVTLELARAGARDDYEGPLALPGTKGEP